MIRSKQRRRAELAHQKHIGQKPPSTPAPAAQRPVVSIVADEGTRNVSEFRERRPALALKEGRQPRNSAPALGDPNLWGAKARSWETRAIPEWSRETRQRLSSDAVRCDVAVADKSVEFPPELKGRFEGAKLTVVGDGDWYHGWSSVERRLNHLTDDRGRTRQVFEPKYIADGRVDLKAIRKARRDPSTMGVAITALTEDQIPKGSRAFVLSPNRFHVPQIAELLANQNVSGVYVEKPMAVNGEQLAQLDALVKKQDKPMYFGDHYLFAAGAMFALMGMKLPYSQMVEITHDPTGKLQKAFDSGKPLLESVVGVRGKADFVGNRNLLRERAWLQEGQQGGGTMLDLQIHLVNVLHMLGFKMKTMTGVTRGVRPAGDAPLGLYETLQKSSTRAEDYAHVKGQMECGTQYDLEVAQFAKQRNNWLMLVGEDGHRLKVDFDTHVVTYQGADGERLGEAKITADPVLLMMHHALSYFESGDNKPMFYEEQRESLRFIDAAKRWKPAAGA